VTAMTTKEKLEIEKRIGELPVIEQLQFVQQLIRQLIKNHFTDHAALERAMDDMVNDPGMQRVLRNEDLKD
jgi:hypothetical protein